MEQLSRTISTESTKSSSWATSLLAAGNGSSPASRKARSSEPETEGGIVERSSVSMPPPASKSMAMRQFPSRRPSKASDSNNAGVFGLFETSGAPSSRHFHSSNPSTSTGSGSAIDETDITPTLEPSRHGSIAAGLTHLPLALPDTAYRSKSDPETESNRMSFSSLYSLGSVIMNNARGLSGPSSVTGSEPEGTVHRTCALPNFFFNPSLIPTISNQSVYSFTNVYYHTN